MPSSSFDNCVAESKSRRKNQLAGYTLPRHIPQNNRDLQGELEATMDRIAMLKEILTANPADAFARYGLAMEYANQGQIDSSLAEFDQLIGAHPDYTAGYFMAAQTLAKAGRAEEAKARLKQGIASAGRTGNQHALGEMQQMLLELE
jgi:predicted Zn-dependent protease